MIAQYATFAMAAILILAIVLEIRTGRIPNWLTALPFLIFAGVMAMAYDRTPLYWQMALAGGVFISGLIMFAIGGMGAGAVKLMSGTVLFISLEDAFYTLIAYLVVFFVSTFVLVQILKMFGSEDSSWHLMANAVIPLSFSIGAAGLIAMFLI
jgi:Flp pilus assembly protein protease CpaA